MIIAITILFLLNLISLSIFAFLLIKKNDEFKTLREQLKRRSHELQALCRGAVGLGVRVTAVERLAQKMNNQPKMNNTPMLDGNHYNQARKLFELGASMDDVMRSCHLSKEEAELVAMLSNTSSRTVSL